MISHRSSDLREIGESGLIGSINANWQQSAAPTRMIEGLCHPPVLSSWRMKKADRANLRSQCIFAVALIKSGQRVATIDLDARQKSFTHFVENRRAWARQIARDLQIPYHFCFGKVHYPTAEDEAAGCKALTDAVDTLARTYGVILIDTPGHDSYLMRLAHSLPIP
jgi:ATPase MipZ